MPKVDVSSITLPQHVGEIPYLEVKESDYSHRLDMLSIML